MSIQFNTNPNLIGGYKPGDQIGAGKVVDPSMLQRHELADTKAVTVDMNRNNVKDNGDQILIVKLPPKGYVPAGWEGKAADGAASAFNKHVIGGAATAMIPGILIAPLSAGAAGAAASAGAFGAKLASSAGASKVAFVVGAAALVALGTVGALSSKAEIVADGVLARASTIPDMVQPKE